MQKAIAIAMIDGYVAITKSRRKGLAYQNSQEPHAFIRIEKDIKNKEIPSLVFLHGKEEYLINWAEKRLGNLYTKESSRALDLTIFDESQFEIDEIISACETMPMMSERKVVILEDFLCVWGKDIKGITKDDISRFTKYLEDLPESLLLIITTFEESIKNGRKTKTSLYKAITKMGKDYDFDSLSQGDLRKFIAKRFRLLGKNAPSREVNFFINESGYYNKDMDYSLYNLKNDIEKIANYADDEIITEDDIRECISESLEKGVFKLIDAVSNNQKEEAFKLLHEILLSGEKPMKILNLIIGQLEIMLSAMEMRGEGIAVPTIEKELKVHKYRLKKAMKAASSYDLKDLKRILAMAMEVENQTKSGKLSFELALELFIAEI